MKARQVNLHRYPGAAGSRPKSLLFVHGAYANSGYWTVHFIPYFQRHGYDCFAVDLAGHGASCSREALDEFGIDDYADDVARALSEIGRPTVVIGHSMGALALQRYLEDGAALAAIFLSPVPPTGTAGSATQLALRYPAFFQALEDTVRGRHSAEDLALMAKVYFSPDAIGEDIRPFLTFVSPESTKAVAEMALLPGRLRIRRRKLPTLVIGGEEDVVFPPSMLIFTALQWDAGIVRIPGAGHMLPIDWNWQVVASRMLEWIDARAAVEVA
jgi:pimeloyl-ACP methyl ester carboxylesterase